MLSIWSEAMPALTCVASSFNEAGFSLALDREMQCRLADGDDGALVRMTMFNPMIRNAMQYHVVQQQRKQAVEFDDGRSDAPRVIRAWLQYQAEPGTLYYV